MEFTKLRKWGKCPAKCGNIFLIVGIYEKGEKNWIFLICPRCNAINYTDKEVTNG